MAIPRISLSIYLLKSSKVEEFRKNVLERLDESFPLVGDLDGSFFPFRAPPKQPAWVAALQVLLQAPAAIDVNTQSAGGMLVVRRRGRTFVICFGHAWLSLDVECIEHDFGRRVALNAIPKHQLLEINSEQVFAKWHLARERAPRATAFDQFGIESERDLVSAIEGVPRDQVLGPAIRGGTSLRVKIPLPTLSAVLEKADALYRSKAHQKLWPELLNLAPIVDPGLVSTLDGQLDVDLSSRSGATKVVLFAPTLRREDYQPAESYVFGRFTKAGATSPYLLYGSWERLLESKGQVPSVTTAKNTAVHLLDDAYDEIASSTVYQCFGYETALKAHQYVLSSGVWYEAAKTFVATINARVSSLSKPSVLLPAWDGSCAEAEYNLRCVKAIKDLLHFDAKNISYGGGASKFEFCDLMHPKKRILYFAKIASRSSDFSHLSEQARRTVELVFSPDDGFRTALKKSVGKHSPKADTAWLDSRPRPGDLVLCLVSLGRTAAQLPFFAKCGLARLVKDLEGRGHSVAFLSV